MSYCPGALCFCLSLVGNTMLYKYKEKFAILQSIGIIVIKSRETRAVTYLATPADILLDNLIPNSIY